MTNQELLRRFFNPRQSPELLGPLKALEEIEDADALERVVGERMAPR